MNCSQSSYNFLPKERNSNMDNQVHNQIVSFIWGIADDCLRVKKCYGFDAGILSRWNAYPARECTVRKHRNCKIISVLQLFFARQIKLPDIP